MLSLLNSHYLITLFEKAYTFSNANSTTLAEVLNIIKLEIQTIRIELIFEIQMAFSLK